MTIKVQSSIKCIPANTSGQAVYSVKNQHKYQVALEDSYFGVSLNLTSFGLVPLSGQTLELLAAFFCANFIFNF